ncbi:tRNA uridine-5-carboxymethylaminomethyl(34) synthesis enzyme MnmG [Sphingomicrobium clamense]|uniref:tRNA uridine 5-carboxymethylaminomethyl modification enzyme MnmG n=1 Tax=Sphingomicrobium clamense TaxID=2851013 RepID=A0ABS6V321_9SPHN|nr:tRNA uridine-5-carboxymethylaminomethyl(34) synthesis enzyme MnmG [Sphingomicrobium sp. B8]MBW0143941.1 tRNA uridine-5-carboxymethylaminomethyl(34) synthesis enzyme MnmG [Sphingomicrobium sp. B8]
MFDVLVIGGGHAGVEAAVASARMGVRTGLISFARDNLGQMSCNPSIGGVGKGHIVREIDVFEAVQPLAADKAAIHYRMLNASKGAAVRGPRVQADRRLFHAAVQGEVASLPIDIIEGEASQLLIDKERVSGVIFSDGTILSSNAVVIATGTFLGGRIFRGNEREIGGRVDERAASLLGDQFIDLGLVAGRLKTGTPPRIDGRTIDWSCLQPQPSDSDRWSLSLRDVGTRPAQLACAITRTNPRTHEIIAANEDRSPLYAGAIDGRGPRYCPSIEDKVRRFSDRDHHQIFLEPEGLDTALVYPNGISTSLPNDVQVEMVRSMEGLERATLATPGYAVEYAYCDPRRLDRRLAHRDIHGLFLAGQINGTTGYEEAAGQGLVAGLNAAARCLEQDPILFDRADSYIGVMVDDLTIHGASEPYRMMTARSEFRLHLRADNAPERLGDLARRTGISDKHRARLDTRAERRAALSEQLDMRLRAEELGLPGDGHRRPLSDWVSRPGGEQAVRTRLGTDEIVDTVLADAIYAPYLERQRNEWEAVEGQRKTRIPADFDFESVHGLSAEMVERLSAARPDTIDQASRVQGVTPAALTAIHLKLARSRAA